MKIRKDKRTQAQFGSENLVFGEYAVINGGYSDKTSDGYSWIHIEDSAGDKYMVGGTTLHKMEELKIIKSVKEEYDIPTKITFGVKNWEIIQ